MASINNKIMFMRLGMPEKKGYCHPYNRIAPLQIGYMIALLKEEYKIDFLDGRITQYPLILLLKRVKKFNPSFVVIDSLAKDRQFVLECAARIKRLSPYIKTICIGPDASTLPEALIFKNSPIDFVLRGECELDLERLLKTPGSPESLKKTKSLYFNEKRRAEIALVEDLDRLPIPQHSLFNPKYYFSIYPLTLNSKLKWGYILSSRGCHHQCLFCSPFLRTSYCSKMRYRSVKNVIKEMLYLKSLGINTISFEDDNFTTSKERLLELCKEMLNKRVGLPWIAHARVTDLSKNIMIAMKRAGCVLLKIGVESGSNRIIDILSKAGGKIDWNKKTREVFKQGKKINLSLHHQR